MFKKLVSFKLILVFLLSLSISAFAKEGVNEEFIIKEIEKAIEVRKNIGHEGFEDLSPGNLISLKDEEHNVSHYLVELDKYGELGGYMILDVSSPSEPVITEFALGNVHPYQDIATSEEAYYFGPLTYAKSVKIKNSIIDLKTQKAVKKEDLENLKKQKQKNRDKLKEISLEDKELSINVIVSRTYRYINNVPDYNQEDISTKKNFCGPVSAANVIMYWNSNGYPNLSSSNNWINVANRLGVLMGHTNSEGVLWADFISGIKSYTTEKGYSKFSITSPAVSFGNMETEIANNRPAQIGLKGYGYTGLYGGHIVTLVGTEKYQETTQNNQWFYNLVIRDNWQSTPKDVWISYGRGGGTIEFIGAIKPSN